MTITTPSARVLSFRATFLALHDLASGQRLLIAAVTNRDGVIVGTDQVIYTNAFDRLQADIRYRYTRQSLEQDIILHENPRIPEEFSPENTRLEIWTEWFNSEPLSRTPQSINLRAADTSGLLTPSFIEDEGLDFGTMKIVTGHAFSSTAQDEQTPVGKSWVRVEDRDWLIETVDYVAVREKLDLLPPARRTASYERPSKQSELIRRLAKQIVPRSTSGTPMLMAKASESRQPAFVMDFVIVSSVPVPAGAISWWPGGGNTNDAISTNQATWIGTNTYAVGKVGQGFSFNGTNYLAVTNAGTLGPTNSLTVETWIWIPSGASGPRIITLKGTPSQKQYLLALDAPGNTVYALVEDSYYLSSTAPLSTNTWHHVAMTYNATNEVLSLYINGQAENPVYAYDGLVPNNDPFFIGGNPDSTYPWRFTGRIDELSVYNRELSASEIQAIYNAGAAGKHNSQCANAPTNIVAWWPGDGNGYDLARTNFATINGATYESAVVAQGFSFDGVNDSVTAAHEQILNLGANDDVTVETWIKPLANTTTYGVMSVAGKRYSPNSVSATGYELFLVNGTPGFQIANSSGVASFIATNYLIGGYHHVAVTMDRDSTNGGCIYVNGTAVLTFNPTVISGSLSNAAPFRIGVHPETGFNGWYKGVIDEVTVYRRALTNTEVTALYAAGSAGKCKVDSDSDGLTDLQESFLGTNPNDSDSDNDGLTDGDEVFVYHTNPNDADTDDDGVDDGVEVTQGRNPLISGITADTNGKIDLKVYTPLIP